MNMSGLSVVTTPMRLLLVLLALVVMVFGNTAEARMYQWVDAETGNVRLSGDPPNWYRNGTDNPRVLVFENGRLIDDTAVVLPQEQRRALREAAFLEVDLRREQDAVKKLERAALREARRREEARAALEAQAASAKTGAGEAEGKENPEDADSPIPEAPAASVVEQLKALISAWDKQNRSVPSP